MKKALETIYNSHHKRERGEEFVLLGDERGTFLKTHVGTGKKVLDIGCRDGALTSYYHTGNTVTGFDIDSEALQRAKSGLGISTIHGDLNDTWDIAQNTFDVVVAAEVVEHLYYPDAVLKKIATVLTEEGMLLGTVPNAFSLKHRIRYFFLKKKGTPLEDPTHINHFTVRELESLLQKQFKEVHVMGIGRHKWLSRTFPQLFAFNLCFVAKKPI